MNTIQLRILIPLSHKAADSVRKIIINNLIHLQITVVDEYEDINSISMTFIIHGIENVDAIEDIMDMYVNERIRYNLLIFWTHNDRKYPSSIRINKKGKKIITRDQKKIMVL